MFKKTLINRKQKVFPNQHHPTPIIHRDSKSLPLMPKHSLIGSPWLKKSPVRCKACRATASGTSWKNIRSTCGSWTWNEESRLVQINIPKKRHNGNTTSQKHLFINISMLGMSMNLWLQKIGTTWRFLMKSMANFTSIHQIQLSHPPTLPSFYPKHLQGSFARHEKSVLKKSRWKPELIKQLVKSGPMSPCPTLHEDLLQKNQNLSIVLSISSSRKKSTG